MFTTLRLYNFKSWEDTERIHLAPITVFFGSNSSGKSSLIQSLLLLKQTVESADRTRPLQMGESRDLVELGRPEDVLFNHDAKVRLGYSLRWTADPERDFPSGQLPWKSASSVVRFRTQIGLERKARTPFVEELRYELGGKTIGMKRRPDGRYDLIDESAILHRKRGRPWPLPDPARFYGFPAELVAYHTNAEAVSDFPLALERQFGRLHYVGPLREPPERQYLWMGQRPPDVGRTGKHAIAALLAARQDGDAVPPQERGPGKRYYPVEQVVAQWLQTLGIIHSFEVKALVPEGRHFEVRVRRSEDAAEVLLPDVGFGVSQVLPVIVQAFYAPENSTVLLEQPELHLHPSAQFSLADALVDASLRKGVQFIVESHSEHFLRRLQRRVAEEKLAADQIALYRCEAQGGRSRIARIEIDEYGNVRQWPKDFFGDTVQDLLTISRETARRRSGK